MDIELLLGQYGNSIIYAFGTAFFATIVAIPTGYVMARWNSIWMKMLFWCCVVLLFLPFQVTMLPQYIFLEKLNLLNTYWAILIPGMVSPLPILIVWIGNKQIPSEFEDAFCLESNSLLSYFRYILLPNIKGIIMASFSICFLLSWNLVDAALIFISDKKLWPLSLTLLELEGKQQLIYGILDVVPVVLLMIMAYLLLRKIKEKNCQKVLTRQPANDIISELRSSDKNIDN